MRRAPANTGANGCKIRCRINHIDRRKQAARRLIPNVTVILYRQSAATHTKSLGAYRKKPVVTAGLFAELALVVELIQQSDALCS